PHRPELRNRPELRKQQGPDTWCRGPCWIRGSVARGGAVLVAAVVGVLLGLPAVPAEVPPPGGLPARAAAHREAAYLLAAPGSPEVAGGVLSHRLRVAHDAQRALGRRERRAR